MKSSIRIIGAGLVGSYLALRLKQLGYDVEIFEKRPDPRRSLLDSGRSINLIVTSRGLQAFHEAEVLQEVVQKSVPVYGREVHSRDGQTVFIPYGVGHFECNFSISRLELNKFLINKAEEAGVPFHFDKALLSCDWNKKLLEFQDGTHTNFGVTIGCDGAGSALRHQMGAAVKVTKEDLGVDYKELYIESQNGSFQLDSRALHIWPARKDNKPFMLMALPNFDGSFTVTSFWGRKLFEETQDEIAAKNFFEEHFPTAIPYLSNFPGDCVSNPQSTLATLRCAPWSYKDKGLLIGDSAHAIVPFFGQGLNLGLESAALFIKHLKSEESSNWESLFSNFFEDQKSNAEAIADMAIDNFEDMSSRSADPLFQQQKRIEEAVQKRFPLKYRSKYGLVTFTCQKYSTIQKLGRLQNKFLKELALSVDSPDELDMNFVEKKIDKELLPFYKSHKLSLESVNEELLKKYSF